MNSTSLKKWLILSVLFFLPVIFLLFLYPSTHNYNSLDIVKNNVKDVRQKLNDIDLTTDKHLAIFIYINSLTFT